MTAEATGSSAMRRPIGWNERHDIEYAGKCAAFAQPPDLHADFLRLRPQSLQSRIV